MNYTSYISVIVIICFTYIQATNGSQKEPITLDEDSWTQLLRGEWMVDFYAPWCPACKSLAPEWKKFAQWSDDLNIRVASADVTLNPGLSGRFLVKGLPTIYHVKDGIFRVYSGPREHTALINFVEEQGWKAVEPISRWSAPDSIQMTILAYSFRISMAFKEVHNYLTENLGWPWYVSYLIFALSTVTLGTILGLLIVFIIDQFCPARYACPTNETKPSAVRRKKKEQAGSDSDLEDKPNQETKNPPATPERVRRRAKS